MRRRRNLTMHWSILFFGAFSGKYTGVSVPLMMVCDLPQPQRRCCIFIRNKTTNYIWWHTLKNNVQLIHHCWKTTMLCLSLEVWSTSIKPLCIRAKLATGMEKTLLFLLQSSKIIWENPLATRQLCLWCHTDQRGYHPVEVKHSSILTSFWKYFWHV